ncbi:unnamed protein product [Ambrosiozyma monospora]|uniref:Unnamed protein product n=1 Tax=Ambrosiozyma monospora TaxID=43982 RepID=A0ACB5TQI1_AMBMO|nr:unnamed protein product [Ambrosiozyma monospora]
MTVETVPPLSYNNDDHSFGFETCRSRWPKILRTAIEDTQIEMDAVRKTNPKKYRQGEGIIEEIKSLAHHIVTDGPILRFCNDDIPGLNSFDDTLGQLEKENDVSHLTWLTGPWLYLECYIYRQIDTYFKKRSEWLDFDVFNRLKRETFISSAMGVYELVIRYKDLFSKASALAKDKTALKSVFEEFIEISLWGNATDLSLLANATLEEIKSVQGSAARANSKKNIIVNDLDLAWDRITQSKADVKRVDFILDNAGFEFFTDVCLTLFLLDTGLVDQVVYHTKTRPWMVSDTMTKDIEIMLQDMLNTQFFPEHRSEVQFFVDAVHKYQKAGKIQAAQSEFWTVDLDFWNINKDEVI